jgi:hypothetical protein
MNLMYTMGWMLPKHSSAHKHEFWYKCDRCIYFSFVCTDIDIANMLVQDHLTIVHYEGAVQDG